MAQERLKFEPIHNFAQFYLATLEDSRLSSSAALLPYEYVWCRQAGVRNETVICLKHHTPALSSQNHFKKELTMFDTGFYHFACCTDRLALRFSVKSCVSVSRFAASMRALWCAGPL